MLILTLNILGSLREKKKKINHNNNNSESVHKTGFLELKICESY